MPKNSLVSYANRHEPNPVPHAKPAHINPAHVDEEPSKHHAVRATRTFQGTITAAKYRTRERQPSHPPQQQHTVLFPLVGGALTYGRRA